MRGGGNGGGTARNRRAAAPVLASVPLLLAAAGALLAGCRLPAALDAAAPEAAGIARLWWLFFAVCAAVWLLVVAALAVASLRRREERRGGDRLAIVVQPPPREERRRALAVGAAAAVTLLVLTGFLVASVATGDRLAAPPAEEPLLIRVTGHQWWWDVRYPGDMAADEVRTANEIHLPLGRPVRFELASGDVIHSLWLPRLHGKRDLLPGRATRLELTPTVPGVFAGRCAEFCGLQHAHMGLRVVVEPPAELAAWLERQRRPAAPPATALARRGQEVFLRSPCVLCHTVRGTPAGGRTAPDLTHLASRATLAAATLPNTREHLAGWVVDSQATKPGNAMPPMPLAGRDLEALLAYLETLR